MLVQRNNPPAFSPVVAATVNATPASITFTVGTPSVRGDMNCDGLTNNFDIDPFVLALTDPAGYAAAWPNCNINNADCNMDGLVNNFDIDAFVAILVGP